MSGNSAAFSPITLVSRFDDMLIVLLFLLSSSACAQMPESEPASWSVLKLVQFHLSIKKNLAVPDVYKMLYQANFGVEHLLSDTAGVRSYLMEEMAAMDTTLEEEALIERISTDGEVVRVNLRPFRKQNLDPELLIRAMFASAAAMKPDTLLFVRQWREFRDLVRYGLLSFPLPAVEELNARIEAGEIVPVHHSERYKFSNSPAYRVVLRRVFERMFGRAVPEI